MCRKNIMKYNHNSEDNEINEENNYNRTNLNMNRERSGMQIHATNYNILRIMHGMSGLAFSN